MSIVRGFNEDSNISPLACGVELAASVQIPRTRVFCLCRAASAYSNLQRPEVALVVVEHALGTALQLEGDLDRPNALLLVSVEFARAGVFERAIRVAGLIESESWRSHALSLVCREYVNDGMLDGAQELAHTIEEARFRDSAFSGIAVALASGGEYRQAIIVAEEIESARARAFIWRKLLDSAIEKAEDPAVEMELRARISDDAVTEPRTVAGAEMWVDGGDQAYDTIKKARKLAKQGLFEDAFEIAKALSGKFTILLPNTIFEVAVECSRNGRLETARRIVSELKEIDLPQWGLVGDLRIALGFAERGHPEECLAVVAETVATATGHGKDCSLHLEPNLAYLSVELAKLAFFELALRTIRFIESTGQRCEALINVGLLFDQSGQTPSEAITELLSGLNQA